MKDRKRDGFFQGTSTLWIWKIVIWVVVLAAVFILRVFGFDIAYPVGTP